MGNNVSLIYTYEYNIYINIHISWCVCAHEIALASDRRDHVSAGDHSGRQAVSPPLDPIISELKFTGQPYININKRQWTGRGE